MNDYDPKEIEPKWQKVWEESGIYEALQQAQDKPKYYSLIEFPYPSGDGLHVGHPRPYIGMDIISRKRRMQGFNVLYPIGWDAFGLPTENYAIKTGKDPRVVTKENSENFKRQIKSLGISFDWSREINTTDPKYYKWTQWLFLKFLENDLAYKSKQFINWCPKDKIGLANEEVVNGKCERCGTTVEKREKEQWMLAITKYAERLDKDLDEVDYSPRIKLQQKNWIGKSEGALIKFGEIEVFTTRPDTIFGATFLAIAPEISKKLFGDDFGIKSETERENKEKLGKDTGHKAINPATKEEIPIWVVNYVSAEYGTGAIMAVPAHDERDYEFAKKYNLPIREVIIPFIVDGVNPPKSGVEFVERQVVHAIIRNPETGKILLLNWKGYPWKTLIIGGVEKEDNGDLIVAARREILEETGFKNLKYIKTLGGQVKAQFYAAHKKVNRTSYTNALVFDLVDEEREEVSEEESSKHDFFWGTLDDVHPCAEVGVWKERYLNGKEFFTGEGVLINSDKFNELESEEAKKLIVEVVGGKLVTKFKLRDWVFSRQRYWGEPIPVIHCDKCGIVPVPVSDLPVELPVVENYQPTDTGESPLANIEEWVNTTCPKCGGAAKRETDTMPNWAGSSWYFLRYTDPHNDKEFASEDALKYWQPVDWYNGGMEHTVLHLLYSRFWNKFLFDLGLVPTSEPYKKRTSHGLILAEGGEKMSKSKGNVINPDDIVNRFGADTLRLYEMFMGPFDQAIAWSEDSLVGPRRFIEKVWKISKKLSLTKSSEAVPGQTLFDEVSFNQVIKKVSDDIETMSFNTAISALMIWVNDLEKREVSQEEYETLLKLLAPFAPHVVEELWQSLGHDRSIHTESWPVFDTSKLAEDADTLAVQINGKVRATLRVASHTDKDEVERLALAMPEIQKWLEGKSPQKVIVVPGKVVNLVTP